MKKIYQKEKKTLIDRTKERRSSLVCTLGMAEALCMVKSLKMQARQKCSISFVFLLGDSYHKSDELSKPSAAIRMLKIYCRENFWSVGLDG